VHHQTVRVGGCGNLVRNVIICRQNLLGKRKGMSNRMMQWGLHIFPVKIALYGDMVKRGTADSFMDRDQGHMTVVGQFFCMGCFE
jgi:hypothetical protein